MLRQSRKNKETSDKPLEAEIKKSADLEHKLRVMLQGHETLQGEYAKMSIEYERIEYELNTKPKRNSNKFLIGPTQTNRVLMLWRTEMDNSTNNTPGLATLRMFSSGEEIAAK